MKKLLLPIVLFVLSPSLALPQDIEKQLADLDPRVYDAVETKNAPTLLGKFLRSERDRVNREDVAAWKVLAAKNDKKAWEEFVRPRIENLKLALGTFPALEAKDVAVHVSKSIPGEGFVIDNLVYESRPGLWVTANLYRPEPLPKSAPGIIVIHSHHNPKTQGELQDMGMMWARAGCYVLVPDQLGHGERREHPFVDEKSYPQPYKTTRQDYFFRYNTGVQLHMVGESLIGWMANDMIAGVTLLLKKPNADPARIVVLGSVAGGGDPSGVTAALDKRVQCLVPFNFGGPQPETKYPLPDDAETSFNFFGGGGSWESTRNLSDSAPGGFFPWVIVSSIAPRHLIHAHEFAWDGQRDPVFKRYEKIWSWYGSRDKLDVAYGRGAVTGKAPDSTHCNNIGPEHRAMIHPLLKKWFGIDVPAGEYKKRIPAAELICWTPELKAKLKPKMMYELAAEMWEKQRPLGIEWPVKNFAASKELAPTRRLYAENVPAKVAVDRQDNVGGVKVRRVVLRGSDMGLEIPLILLEPEKASKGRIVVAVTQNGRQALLKERRAEIAGLLKNGIAVCLPDILGTGEVGQRDSRTRTSGSTSVSSSVRMLGNSMAAMQADSLHQVIGFLSQDAKAKKTPFQYCIWSESLAKVNGPKVTTAIPYDVDPVPAQAEHLSATAYALTHLSPNIDGEYCRGVLSRGGLVRLASALQGPFFYAPHDVLDLPVFPHTEADDLAVFAFRQAKGKIKSGVCRFEALVDGLNRPASSAEVDASFGRLRKQFGATDRVTVNADRSGPEEVVRWLAKCFE
jgi:dienelactone hydrolase